MKSEMHIRVDQVRVREDGTETLLTRTTAIADPGAEPHEIARQAIKITTAVFEAVGRPSPYRPL